MSRIFFILALLMALATTHALANTEAGEEHHNSSAIAANGLFSAEVPPSLEGMRSVLARYNPRAPRNCHWFPMVCRAKGSPGPDCCKKICVNVMVDNLNCGKCGRGCKYGEVCCGGNCVNLMHDHKNCGGCGNKCEKGHSCRYGMCSYA